MGTTSPARIDDDLYASAKLAGSVQSRSASQQVVHWARIGREIEASSSISHRAIAEVLAGSRSYDTLDAKAQAVVRAEWSSRMGQFRDALDLARTFKSTGRTWVELDADGAVVERDATSGRAAAPTPSPAKAAKAAAVGKRAQGASGADRAAKQQKRAPASNARARGARR